MSNGFPDNSGTCTVIGRAGRIDRIDDDTGAVLDSRTIADFQDVVGLARNVSGDATIRATNFNPDSHAVLGGLFLNPPGSGA